MIIRVRLPLLNSQNPNPQAIETEAQALADANELLNDGYELIFREQVAIGQEAVANLYFYKAAAAIESPLEASIKEAFRIFRAPPTQNGVGGGHPDTRRLNDVIRELIKSGVQPDDEPPTVTDETQVDVTPRKLQEVKW